MNKLFALLVAAGCLTAYQVKAEPSFDTVTSDIPTVAVSESIDNDARTAEQKWREKKDEMRAAREAKREEIKAKIEDKRADRRAKRAELKAKMQDKKAEVSKAVDDSIDAVTEPLTR